jgi:hypothetical protein
LFYGWNCGGGSGGGSGPGDPGPPPGGGPGGGDPDDGPDYPDERDDGDDGCIPEEEICDNVDNDCDGKIDEDLKRPNPYGCEEDICENGVWQGKTPKEEVCDGKDNDCDQLVDEEIFGQACQTECGVGYERCIGGKMICEISVPNEEICDGKDNDCDGYIDEDLVQKCPCGETKVCEDGKWSKCPPCGECIEDQVCYPGALRWCDGPTYCYWGIQVCRPDGTWGVCEETHSKPEECKHTGSYDQDCCLKAGGCCEGRPWGKPDSPSVGKCAGIACGFQDY